MNIAGTVNINAVGAGITAHSPLVVTMIQHRGIFLVSRFTVDLNKKTPALLIGVHQAKHFSGIVANVPRLKQLYIRTRAFWQTRDKAAGDRALINSRVVQTEMPVSMPACNEAFTALTAC